MSTPVYGIVIQEESTAPLPVQSGDFSVIGVICPVDDANTTTFPLNTPVAFNSTDPNFLSEVGTGDFCRAITSINNQLAQFESAATVVAVLVARGSTTGATITNLLGVEGSFSGIYAFLKAGALTGFIPRIIICPGYTGYQALSVTNPVVTAGGTGYTSTPTVAFSPSGATATATVVSSSVTAITMTNPGNYAPGTSVTGTITGGGGSGATFTVTLTPESNPILAALPAVLNGLLAVAYVGSVGDGVIANTIAWRQTLASDRLFPADVWVIPNAVAPPFSIGTPTVVAGTGYTGTATVVFSAVGGTTITPATATAAVGSGGITGVTVTNPGLYEDGAVVTAAIVGNGTGASVTFAQTSVVGGTGGFGFSDGVAEAAGLQVATDFKNAGIPGWSISGSQVNGILGLKNIYSFSLTDGSTQGQQLLADQVSVIEAGAIASDTAIAASGYVWAGVWNASTLPTTWFANQRRMKDYVNLALVKSIRAYLGVDNVTPHAVQAVLNNMQVLGSFLLSKQISLGFQVSFNPSENSPTQLAQGQFTVTFANQTPPPITQVTVESTDFPEAFTVELATIIQAANTLSPGFLTT
jgi:uncharacterized protein